MMEERYIVTVGAQTYYSGTDPTRANDSFDRYNKKYPEQLIIMVRRTELRVNETTLKLRKKFNLNNGE